MSAHSIHLMASVNASMHEKKRDPATVAISADGARRSRSLEAAARTGARDDGLASVLDARADELDPFDRVQVLARFVLDFESLHR
jgi:DnaJ-domain-containing protein 1